jgi:hypothetical protein
MTPGSKGDEGFYLRHRSLTHATNNDANAIAVDRATRDPHTLRAARVDPDDCDDIVSVRVRFCRIQWEPLFDAVTPSLSWLACRLGDSAPSAFIPASDA